MLVYLKGAIGDPGGQGLPGEMGVKVGILLILKYNLFLGHGSQVSPNPFQIWYSLKDLLYKILWFIV